MLLAADEINFRGGINGRKIRLIIEDSQTSPEEGQKAFNKIEAAHQPILYVSTLSAVSVALTPLAEENKVVLVGLVAATQKLTEGKKWVFRYYTTAQNEVPPIISVLEDLKVKTLGILYLKDEYGISVFEILKERFERVGGTVSSEAFGTNEFDFREQIATLKDMEAIYAVGYVSHLKEVYRQLKENDFEGPILGPSGVLNLVGKATEINGIYVAAPIIYDPNFVFATDVKEKFETRYGKTFTHQAATGYDFVKLLASLLEDESISREHVKHLLDEGFIYPGVFGDLDVKPGEHDIIIPLHPAQVVDGEITYLR